MSTEAALRRLLAETEESLAAAELELHKVQERVAELQAERYGLQLALARRHERQAVVGNESAFDDPEPDASAQVPPETFWQMLSRAEAVERVLEGSPTPLTRQEVVSVLQRFGRTGDTPDAVSAALAYLQRIDRAARAGRNQWVLVP